MSDLEDAPSVKDVLDELRGLRDHWEERAKNPEPKSPMEKEVNRTIATAKASAYERAADRLREVYLAALERASKGFEE